jgi:hypothetical protein
MLMIAVVVVCALLLPLTGGSFARLATIRLHTAWLVGIALALQIVTISIVPHGNHDLHAAAYLASYALVVAFLWVNRSTAGFALLAIGTLFNLTAIAANGGTMPASATALRVAGIASRAGTTFRNSTVVPHSHLAFLGDIFAVPANIPLHNVFSVGDVLIVLGACQTILTIGASRLVPHVTTGLLVEPATAEVTSDAKSNFGLSNLPPEPRDA